MVTSQNVTLTVPSLSLHIQFLFYFFYSLLLLFFVTSSILPTQCLLPFTSRGPWTVFLSWFLAFPFLFPFYEWMLHFLLVASFGFDFS